MKNTIIFVAAAIATFALVVLGGFAIYLNFLKKEADDEALTASDSSAELE